MSTPLRRRARRRRRRSTWPLTTALALLLALPAVYVLAGGRMPWERPAGRRGGALSELYYPDLNTPQIRQLRFLVGDGKRWLADLTRDAQQAVRRPDPKALLYTLTDTDPQGRYTLVQEVLTDPDHESVAVRLRFTASAPGLHLYAVLDPHLGGTGAGNTLRYVVPADTGPAPPYAGVTAVAEGNGYAAVLATSAPWQAFTATFLGPGDALHQLAEGHAFPEQYDAARGRVAGLIDLGAPAGPVLLTIGFGKDAAAARREALASRRWLGRPAPALHGWLALLPGAPHQKRRWP